MLCTNCSQRVKPIVAVDIDGTLADYHHAFTAFCCRYFGMPRPSGWWNGEGEFEDYLGITKQQYRDAKMAYRQGGNKRWATMFPDADKFVYDILVLDVEIWLTTTRPWLRLDNVDPDTRHWLVAHNIPHHGLLYDDDKYAKLCDVVDADRIIGVIDDLPEMLSVAAGRGLPTFQIERDHNRTAASRWTRRGGFSEAYEWLVTQRNDWDWRHSHDD